MIARWLRRLDGVLYRHPFEGTSARRYAAAERPAFGDLDDRLLDELAPLLTVTASARLAGGAVVAPRAESRTLLDLGAGPATFAARAAARFPELSVLAIEPSRDFARPVTDVAMARAVGEALPLADTSVDVAMCLSSIRHVRDRAATLRELRRVVRPGGTCWIVELDPAASARRIANHAGRIGSPLLRVLFGPLVVRTAPAAETIRACAEMAGWNRLALRDDPVQPVYIMELV